MSCAMMTLRSLEETINPSFNVMRMYVGMNATGEHDVTWAEIWRPLYGSPSEMKFPYAFCNTPMRMFVAY